MNQAEHIAMVLPQQTFQASAIASLGTFVRGCAHAGKRAEDLTIQLAAGSYDQKRKLGRQFAMNFFAQKRHRIRFARTLLDRSHAPASLPLSYGFPVCQHWSARIILHVFSRVCALYKINLALQFWLNLMAVTLRLGNAT